MRMLLVVVIMFLLFNNVDASWLKSNSQQQNINPVSSNITELNISTAPLRVINIPVSWGNVTSVSISDDWDMAFTFSDGKHALGFNAYVGGWSATVYEFRRG